MNVSILTLFPELYQPFLNTSLVQRAQEAGKVSIRTRSLFEFCAPKERVDGPIFGHGPGMVIKPEVVERAITAEEAGRPPAFKIFFSPQGERLNQPLLKDLYRNIEEHGGNCMLLPARYEGMDARIEDEYADAIVSIGDYVLMGGDLPAMVLLEGLLRLEPGVVGKAESVEDESFSGAFVDYPHYTAPVTWKGHEVPEVIRSGDHGAQKTWQQRWSAQKTVEQHFQWLRSCTLNEKEWKLAAEFIPPHYVALMHGEVVVDGGREGDSSVTSIDIHDIARSATTYGLKGYFVVTPLIDQQKIVEKLLDFWHIGRGVTYNPSRHQAVKSTHLATDIDEVIATIERQEGARPLLIATSAQEGIADCPVITYYDQKKIWQHKRPVLFLFGTARGLGSSLLKRCDYVLCPIVGFSPFNHLSVRSAAAVVFDRWLGISPNK